MTDGVTLFVPAVIALVLGFVTLADRGRRIDPTLGGLIGCFADDRERGDL